MMQYNLNNKAMGSKGNTTQREALMLLQGEISRDFVLKRKILSHLIVICMHIYIYVNLYMQVSNMAL